MGGAWIRPPRLRFSKCQHVLKGGGKKKNGPVRSFLFPPAATTLDTLGSPALLFLFCRSLDDQPRSVGLLPRQSLAAASLSEMSEGGKPLIGLAFRRSIIRGRSSWENDGAAADILSLSNSPTSRAAQDFSFSFCLCFFFWTARGGARSSAAVNPFHLLLHYLPNPDVFFKTQLRQDGARLVEMPAFSSMAKRRHRVPVWVGGGQLCVARKNKLANQQDTGGSKGGGKKRQKKVTKPPSGL